MAIRIDLIAGARPNFVKIAPIVEAISRTNELKYRLIHTGQHYDKNMSEAFFDQLGIPKPDINLGAGGGTQADQTAKIMVGYERLLMEESTDLCVVVGDVTSTMACSIAAKKLCIPVAHVEAGIRSGDIRMPEEINRIVTDSITDYFFTTSEWAGENLRKLGIGDDRIFFVGNTMIDTLVKQRPHFIEPAVWRAANLQPKGYLVLTLHRPSNVDQEEALGELIDQILKWSLPLPIIFPVHPRTRIVLDRLGISDPRLHMIEPLSYLEFNYLVERAKGVITDSGGITEEATVMSVPCMTLRDSTERPETVSIGTNELLGVDPSAIKPALSKLLNGEWKTGSIPPLWDGNTSGRIVAIIERIFKGHS